MGNGVSTFGDLSYHRPRYCRRNHGIMGYKCRGQCSRSVVIITQTATHTPGLGLSTPGNTTIIGMFLSNVTV